MIAAGISKGRALPCALAVISLALPASAAARDTFVTQRPGSILQLSLHGSHGYRISVTNDGAKRRVILSAHTGGFGAAYAVRGRAMRNRIEGNFGKLGKVSVWFQPSSQKPARQPLDEGCTGKPSTVQAGRFVGTVRFHGEEGFSSVVASSAPGSVTTEHKIVCTFSARKGPAVAQSSRNGFPDVFEREFVAVEADHNHSTLLNVFQISHSGVAGEKGSAAGEVATTEHRGRIAIARDLRLREEINVIQASPLGIEPFTATIAAPGQLQGTGQLSESLGSPPSWSGDLSARLPGGGMVPLVGPGFTTAYCQGKDSSALFESCEEELEEQLFLGVRYPLGH
jgi:hypothetical protein